MDIQEIDRIAREYMLPRRPIREREPGWAYTHGLRVARIAVDLAAQLNADVNPDILHVAGLLHDVSKGADKHNEKGARKTRKLLKGVCRKDELKEIMLLVELHNQRGNPDHPLAAKILQDADTLDHIGPMAAWLAFYWSGSREEDGENMLKFIGSESNVTDRANIRELLNFDLSKTLFDKRAAWEREFFGSFAEVYAGGIFEPKPR